jgi:hypothetical protein
MSDLFYRLPCVLAMESERHSVSLRGKKTGSLPHVDRRRVGVRGQSARILTGCFSGRLSWRAAASRNRDPGRALCFPDNWENSGNFARFGAEILHFRT